MNRMRMQSSPRPASARRVVAGKRTRPDETKNCVRKLLKREISRAGNLAFTRTNSQEKFRNFHLQVCVCVDQVSVNFLVQREERGELVSLAPLRISGFRVVFSAPQPRTWYPFVDDVLTRVFFPLELGH
jgi:hypothetical protein